MRCAFLVGRKRDKESEREGRRDQWTNRKTETCMHTCTHKWFKRDETDKQERERHMHIGVRRERHKNELREMRT